MPIIDDAKAESYEELMDVVRAGTEQFLDDEGRACYMRKADCVSTNYNWFPRNTLTQFNASALTAVEIAALVEILPLALSALVTHGE